MFVDEPRHESTGTPYDIVRVQPGRPVTGVILSRRHVGAELHYWKGRSRLHQILDCEACLEGYAPRWYGYVYVMRSGIGSIQILEFTARCWPVVREYYGAIGDLRGAKFNCRRLRDQTNAPLALTLSEERVPQSGLPDPPPLNEVLARMWEVTLPAAKAGDSGKVEPTTVLQSRAEGNGTPRPTIKRP